MKLETRCSWGSAVIVLCKKTLKIFLEIRGKVEGVNRNFRDGSNNLHFNEPKRHSSLKTLLKSVRRVLVTVKEVN